MTAIPAECADAVTVPGAVASWAKLIADHGTMTLSELLAPAIDAAEHGYPVTERVARDWAKQVDKLRRNAAATEIFLPNGAAPRPGDIHKQPALAAALRSIASDGPAAFYRGWIARDMVDALRAAGGCHTLDGLRRLRSRICNADPRELPWLRRLGVSAQWAGPRSARDAESARRLRSVALAGAVGRALPCT